ncbi:hypothetical protein BKM31_19050 [[Actinomadura] parvosata subsp. kistnae]|uniref:T4 beta protein n=2 Tax=Nonomuraea TaxID=83681 RepID=A0A1U9ZZC7_9ACTN|nr:hypothetical protein BKM31_19050 [Nonomuraea sp. ATCC 55076]
MRFANRTENQVMTVYMPILRGRASEFQVIGQTLTRTRRSIRPLVEIMPMDTRVDDKRQELLKAISVFEERLKRYMSDDDVFAVDCKRLFDRYEHAEVCGVMTAVSAAVKRAGRCMIPVVRPTDDEREFQAAGRAATQHGRGACIRVAGRGTPTPAQTAQLSRTVRHLMGLTFKQVDLVLDMWAIESDVALTERVERARQALKWAAHLPVRSVVLAAGAFPKQLTDIPFETATPLPRRDATLWTAAAPFHAGNAELGYGDYGVASPGGTQGRRPHPNLRYTIDDHWDVYRCSRQEGDGAFSGFRKLCQAAIADHWPPHSAAFSWGDQQIEAFASHQTALPNQPDSWRACGMSHHIATVVDRLARLGQP